VGIYKNAIFQDQLNAANDALLERKKLQAEQDKILELRVLEHQKAKAEREAAFEREQASESSCIGAGSQQTYNCVVMGLVN